MNWQYNFFLLFIIYSRPTKKEALLETAFKISKTFPYSEQLYLKIIFNIKLMQPNL